MHLFKSKTKLQEIRKKYARIEMVQQLDMVGSSKSQKVKN